jgi:hypothetical protein
MPSFEWDETKNQHNILKHQVDFFEAQQAFLDPHRLIFKDINHSTAKEIRYYCIGKIKKQICTVRFTYRQKNIRIIGAGYWRNERKIYETTNQTK